MKSARTFPDNSSPLILLAAFWMLMLSGLTGCGTETNSQDDGDDQEWIERTSQKGPVRLTVRVTPPQPRLSDVIRMEVHVTAEEGVTLQPPTFGAAAREFLIRDYSETSPPQQEGAGRSFLYQLEPVQTGRHLIRAVAVEFADRRESADADSQTGWIESEPIELIVISELGDQQPDLAMLEPMLPPREPERRWSWGWTAAVVCVLALAVLLAALLRRRRTAVEVVHVPSPEETAQEELARLLSEDLPSQGRFGEFYLRLTGIVRRYIESTTGLRAPEQTTEEFLRAMRSHPEFPADRSVRLQEFLEAADMVKYAAVQPDAQQVALATDRAREFIGWTRRDPL